jgi:hypothetical protein
MYKSLRITPCNLDLVVTPQGVVHGQANYVRTHYQRAGTDGFLEFKTNRDNPSTPGHALVCVSGYLVTPLDCPGSRRRKSAPSTLRGVTRRSSPAPGHPPAVSGPIGWTQRQTISTYIWETKELTTHPSVARRSFPDFPYISLSSHSTPLLLPSPVPDRNLSASLATSAVR